MTFILFYFALLESLNLKELPQENSFEKTIVLQVKNMKFYSIQFDIFYNPEEIVFLEIQKGPVARDTLFAENHKNLGVLKVALASSKEIEEEGILFYFKFKGKGKICIKNILIDDRPHKDIEFEMEKLQNF